MEIIKDLAVRPLIILSDYNKLKSAKESFYSFILEIAK